MSGKKFWIILTAAIIFTSVMAGALKKYVMRAMERTNEEYAAVLIDNKEDFDYVAEMMQQWPEGSFIDFGSDISSENPDIENEIANNKEFYEHLKNLYDLEEVLDIVQCGKRTEFGFRKAPMDYHGGWFYWVDPENAGGIRTIEIDEHWTLEMLPNV